MPVYAYECNDCGVRFERRQGFNDAAVTICPECEGAVRRLIQPAGVIFKGSGFYVTDHKSGSTASSASKKAETTSETTSEAKSEAKTSTKSETKSESKSEAKAATSTD